MSIGRWMDKEVGVQFSSVQSLSHVRLSVTPWTAARQASLSITNSQSQHKPISIESMMPSDHLILCRPLLLLPSVFPSIRVFSNESALCIREMQNKTTTIYHLLPVRMAAIKKSTNNNCWRWCGKKGDSLTLLVRMQTTAATIENSVEIP